MRLRLETKTRLFVRTNAANPDRRDANGDLKAELHVQLFLLRSSIFQ